MKKKRKIVLISILIIIIFLAFAVYAASLTYHQANASPTIEMDSSSIAVSVSSPEEELLSGVTAHDKEDGDITSSLVVEGVSNIIEGSRAIVTYAAFDSSGNVAKASRDVLYSDYSSPVFDLTSPMVFRADSSISILDRITASDCVDGDISYRIKATNLTGGGISGEGVYNVEFRVTNSMGDTSRITIPIDVCSYERIRCPIELKSNVVHLKMGYTFTPSKYVLSYSTPYSSAKIPVTEDNISLFSIYSDVDMTVPGCYSVTYSLITGDGSMGYTRMIAIVEE